MFEKSAQSAGAFGGAVFAEVFGLVGKLIAAVEKVLVEGLTEHVDARFSVFGRRIGIKAEVSLLDRKPEA